MARKVTSAWHWPENGYWSARLLTAFAMMAKPRPASPARAASTLALSASSRVSRAICSIAVEAALTSLSLASTSSSTARKPSAPSLSARMVPVVRSTIPAMVSALSPSTVRVSTAEARVSFIERARLALVSCMASAAAMATGSSAWAVQMQQGRHDAGDIAISTPSRPAGNIVQLVMPVVFAAERSVMRMRP